MGVAAGVNPEQERAHFDLCQLWLRAIWHIDNSTEMEKRGCYSLARSSREDAVRLIKRIGTCNLEVSP
jgi:hypothetical protein